MNVLHAYTRRCLKKNRIRTIMTIIGITLSVAMFTAVTEATASALNYIVELTKMAEGGYHALFSDMTAEECDDFVSNEKVKTSTRLSNEGYALLDEDLDYIYIYLAGMDDDIEGLIPITVTEGRMPENENEVIVPNHLRSKALSKLKLGAELELELGQRVCDGEILNNRDAFMPDEELAVRETRTVTIVGFYYRLPTDFESYDTPGYTVLTLDKDGSPYDDYLLAFELDKPRDVPGIIEKYGEEYHIETNGRLLAFMNSSLDDDTMRITYTLDAILILIIMFGSIMLIYNSFAISISERTKQFGLLKSIGATKRQIRDSVAYEAFVLCLFGIPLGLVSGSAGIGITFSLLGDSMGRLFSNGDLAMRLVITPPALIAAAVIGFATTLISALIPAAKAAKLTPIEAIRQSSDVKIKGRQVKSRALIKWLFGFEGDIASKNFRRNKKRYRAVVVSLFSSIVLFIATSTFCSYLTGSVEFENDDNFNGDILITQYDTVCDTAYCGEVLGSIRALPHVDSACMKFYTSTFFRADSEYIDDAYPEEEISGYFIFIDDVSFRELCKQYDLDPEDYYGDEPKTLVFDKYEMYYSDNGSDEGNIFSNDTPDTLSYDKCQHIPGYMMLEKIYEYDEASDNYVTYYVYGDIEYVGMDNSGLIANEEHTKRFKESDVLENCEFDVGAVIHVHSSDYNGLNVVMPQYRMDEMTGGFNDWMHIAVYAEDYLTAETEIGDLLTEINGPFGYSNRAAGLSAEKAFAKIMSVMAYGFIILISLIALVNVFNTISTSVILRRREFATLRSVGMTRKGFYKMMNYECLLYGVRSVAAGVPVSLLVSFLIHWSIEGRKGYSLPWFSIAVAVGSVFVVVFVSMLYAMHSIRRDDTIETLRNENI